MQKCQPLIPSSVAPSRVAPPSSPYPPRLLIISCDYHHQLPRALTSVQAAEDAHLLGISTIVCRGISHHFFDVQKNHITSGASIWTLGIGPYINPARGRRRVLVGDISFLRPDKLPSRHGFDVSTSLLYIIIAASTSIDQHSQPSRITKKLASSKRLTTRACRGYIHILPGSGKLPSRHGFDGPSAIGHHHRSFDVNQLISICNRLASRRIWPGAPTVLYLHSAVSSIGPHYH